MTYTFNTDSRNRLTNITRGGTLTVAGIATNNAASVTVNGQAAIIYGNTFAAAGVSLNDGPNTFTAVAEDIYGRKASNSLSANYPAAISFTYDANGNLTSDGTREFRYDGENRLTKMFVTGQWRTLLFYDGLGRKRIRREYNWVSGAWNLTNEVRYLYDGFLLLQERNSANVPRVTYTRGIDLSGSFSGAGGIGGLLGMTTHAQTTNYTHYFYHSDALGNITALQDTNKVIQGKWAYEPWGQLFSMSGPLTNLNRMRQSGKEWHPQSGLMDFGARLYNPTWQRWMNEDPIRELGGWNLFAYVFDSPLNWTDTDGLAPMRGAPPGGRRTGFEGEITREIRENMRNRRLSPQERFEERARALETERELRQRYPGHRPGDSYIGPPPPQNRPIRPGNFSDEELARLNPNTCPKLRPGRHGGPEHRNTVAERARELQEEGHTLTAGGSVLPEQGVRTPEGRLRYPDISTIDPFGRPYYENIGRSTRQGEPISRERAALNDIRRATGTEPGYTPYDR